MMNIVPFITFPFNFVQFKDFIETFGFWFPIAGGANQNPDGIGEPGTPGTPGGIGTPGGGGGIGTPGGVGTRGGIGTPGGDGGGGGGGTGAVCELNDYRIASCSDDKRISIWIYSVEKEITLQEIIFIAHSSFINRIISWQNGNIASCSEDNNIHI